MINKSLPTEVKVLDEEEGLIEAFVNTMGVVDHDNDIIEPSAFNRSISKLENVSIPVLYGHDQSQIIGKVTTAKSMDFGDSHRLYARMQINMDKQAGRDAFSDIKGKFIERWSVGFNMNPDGWEMDKANKTPIRRIKDLDWVEVSAVIRGASPDTATIGTKSEDPKPLVEVFSDVATEEPTDGQTASDADLSASDTELAKVRSRILKAQMELKMPKKPKKKKPRY